MSKLNPSAIKKQRYVRVSSRYGLLIGVLVLITLLIETTYPLLSSLVAIAAVITLVIAFITGYNQSDELEKLVQLKAAAISFIAVMCMTFLINILDIHGYVSAQGTASTIFAIGFLLHLVLLPVVAQRGYEE